MHVSKCYSCLCKLFAKQRCGRGKHYNVSRRLVLAQRVQALCLPPLPLLVCRDVSYRGFWLVPWLFAKPEAERQAVVQKTLKLMEDKVMDPPIGKEGRDEDGLNLWGLLAYPT